MTTLLIVLSVKLSIHSSPDRSGLQRGLLARVKVAVRRDCRHEVGRERLDVNLPEDLLRDAVGDRRLDGRIRCERGHRGTQRSVSVTSLFAHTENTDSGASAHAITMRTMDNAVRHHAWLLNGRLAVATFLLRDLLAEELHLGA